MPELIPVDDGVLDQLVDAVTDASADEVACRPCPPPMNGRQTELRGFTTTIELIKRGLARGPRVRPPGLSSCPGSSGSVRLSRLTNRVFQDRNLAHAIQSRAWDRIPRSLTAVLLESDRWWRRHSANRYG
jgi:hypothetical protein